MYRTLLGTPAQGTNASGEQATFEFDKVLGLDKALRVLVGAQPVTVDDDVGWDRDPALLQEQTSI